MSIRLGWFYHPDEDDKVKTVDELTELYYCSVGRNATLLLNFPVDRNGLINPTDSANAVNFHRNIMKQLSCNVLAGASVSASDFRGAKYSPVKVCDGDFDTYYNIRFYRIVIAKTGKNQFFASSGIHPFGAKGKIF